MGHASPQPIVITTSEARTASSVSGFGNSSLMSTPISVIASITAGLMVSAGSLPAERTWILPREWSRTSPAAIWLRPALWTHTNRTSGAAALPDTPIAGTATCALQRAPHQFRVVGMRLVPLRGDCPRPLARRREDPRVRVVGEGTVEHGVDLLTHTHVLHRHEHLDPVIEVALHEVGAADVGRDALIGLERVHAAVLEEATDDGADGDVVRETLDAGP